MIFIIIYALIALAIYSFTVFSLNYIELDKDTLQGIQGLIIPQTNGERILWVFMAFTAGFCGIWFIVGSVSKCSNIKVLISGLLYLLPLSPLSSYIV